MIATKLHRFLRSRGDAARDRRNWKSAISYYRSYLRWVPGDAAIIIQLGHAWKESGSWEEARRCYERALEINSSDADLHLQLGHLHKVSGNVRNAIGSYFRALEIDPDFSEAKREILQYDASVLSEAEDARRAEDAADMDSLVARERDRAENIREANLDRPAVRASERTLNSFVRRLPDPRVYGDESLVPPILHFVHGFRSGGDIPYYGFLAIQSALYFNPGWRAFFYCPAEPAGPNWERIKSKLTVIICGTFEYFKMSRIVHPIHKADIVRLIVLNRVGGVFLDLDTITQRSYSDLRYVDFCMGVQAAGWTSPPGLCNAVMIGRSGATFSTKWLEYYDSFRSLGRDRLWDYHSFRVPVLLMQQAPDTIHVLGHRAFSYPLWYTSTNVLLSDEGQKYKEALSDAYCFCLWSEKTGKSLEVIDDEFVRTSSSVYADLARRVIEPPK
jgi:tetratricopeptide (TPR) repeat protein